MNAADRNFEAAAAAFAASVIGGALPPVVEALIAQAGALRDRPGEALPLLERARVLAPQHPAPVIAVYRFHFYGHALVQARAAGEDALAIARTALGPDFGDVPPEEEAVRGDAAVRFYLFTLKGLAYLNLRLRALDEARLMLGELRRLDPQDHLGGGLLSHVLAGHDAGEPILPAEGPGGYPARGWAPIRKAV
ncbi:MAG: hypothetical protein LWW96_17965 [Acidovorax sp.]|uniref:hypothetical protein n=1 Tax=Acidovorax sp. TaxID=1872122 RepID=UPI0025C47A44|nr:hypothetical protein [Acidovorax sp.]MCE1194037.1 hypothetical protein [Acidovorax sp.]